ncbi:MAG: glycoside hydrolase family 97 catalytic domain-containing protein, partial [Polyangiales bacterium]
MKTSILAVRCALLAMTLGALGCESGPTDVSSVQLGSPNGRVQISVTTDSEGRMSYTVSLDGGATVESSPLGLVSTTHDLSAGVTMSSSASRAIDEAYTMPTGKRRERQVRGNEITVPLRDATGARAELILRAHDDGVAFRYRLLGEGTSQVMGESTGFAIPSNSRVLTRAYDAGDFAFVVTAGEYQQPPVILSVGEAIEATGFAFPSLFEIEGGARYAMVTEADLDRSYCGTRLNETPEGNLYRIRFPDEREGRGIGEVLPSAELPFATPWRVIAIGDLSTIVESTFVDDLSRPSVVEDTSWIAPGRADWSWFSQETGTPELQSEYVAFAGEYGWDYVLIDAKWDQWDRAEQAVQDLVSQADAVGVRLLLWYNSGGAHTTSPLETPLNRMSDPTVRRAEMEKISGWGIAGIKVDFFNSDKQDRINQYIGILEDAKDYGLLVNFHGATVPRGWQRTYPHLMTQEAVNGAEVYKFASAGAAPSAIINVRHALLRNVVGSMDYTPVVFERALAVEGLPYVHSLALSALFESGIQHFADRADSNTQVGYRAVFAAYPYVGDFLSTVPVAWDETRLIEGDIDSHVILARRSATDWYVAGIQATDAPVEYSFPLDFLDAGVAYELALIEQGPTPSAFERTVLSVI